MLTGMLAARNLLGQQHDPWSVNTDRAYGEARVPVKQTPRLRERRSIPVGTKGVSHKQPVEAAPAVADKPAAYWDGVGAAWDNGEPQALWRRHSDTVHSSLLAGWLGPERAGRLLKTDLFDEASGPGLYPLLATKARTVVGIDISPVVQRAAGRRHPSLQTSVADVRRLPFEDGSFDAIVSNSTLDHFNSRADILVSLREMRRILRPGGHLLLTMDNPANPAVRLRNALPLRWLNRLRLVPYQVGVTCGRRHLRAYARQAGLEVLETAAVMHCPRAPAVALAGWLQRRAHARHHERFLRCLRAFEELADWPSRFLTGHFVAIRAIRPTRDAGPSGP